MSFRVNWACPECAYHNSIAFEYCKLCNTRIPSEPTQTNNQKRRPNIRRIDVEQNFNTRINQLTLNADNHDGDQSLVEEDSKINQDDHKSMDEAPSQLRQYAPRPTSCNGDCGAAFSKLINNIINAKVM